MINLGTRTKYTPEQVLERATAYFGGTLGLESRPDEPGCLTFSGGGGYVSVTATAGEDGKTDVGVIAKEWERDATAFVAQLGSH